MHNPPRPSIAQRNRRFRHKAHGGQNAPTNPLTLTKPPLSQATEPPQAVAPLGPAKPPQALNPSAAAELPKAEAPQASVLPVNLAGPKPPVPIAPPSGATAAPGKATDSLPAGLRLKPMPPVIAEPKRAKGPLVLAAFGLLAVGAAAGYLARESLIPSPPQGTTDNNPANPAAHAPSPPPAPLTPELQRDLDAAFEAMKSGHPADARTRLAALLKQRPDWTTLNFEMARAALYQRDFDAAEALLDAGKSSGAISVADAEFLLALLRMNAKRFEFANHSFERAASADPTRADIFFFWGDCLRRQGKPFEASEKLRSALLRNQYETAESLYQTKLWLSEIQADQDTASGSKAIIDAGLAEPHPSSAVLLAAAGRELKAGEFSRAADYVDRASQILAPDVFRVVLQDPTFLQESWRPEMMKFYHQPTPPEPAAPSPAPSPQASVSQTPLPESAASSPAPSPQASVNQMPSPEPAASSPAPSPQASVNQMPPPEPAAPSPAATPQARETPAPTPRAKMKPAASPRAKEKTASTPRPSENNAKTPAPGKAEKSTGAKPPVAKAVTPAKTP